jgi:hypothetical protein
MGLAEHAVLAKIDQVSGGPDGKVVAKFGTPRRQHVTRKNFGHFDIRPVAVGHRAFFRFVARVRRAGAALH